MAEADFTFIDGGLDAATVARGVSSGFTPPNGGGSFVFGFDSKDTSLGAVGLRANQTNFDPLLNDSGGATGGSIRGAIKRGTSPNPTGFAPMLFIGLQKPDVGDQGYLLGLSDNDPNEIVLRKGAPVGGLDPSASDILIKGTATFIPDVWHHLRLDMIVNPNGDVILKAFQNDLDANPVTSPSWVEIPGMEGGFTDDALGINSGSLPFTGGHIGFGFQTNDISRRAFFDHIEVFRQK